MARAILAPLLLIALATCEHLRDEVPHLLLLQTSLQVEVKADGTWGRALLRPVVPPLEAVQPSAVSHEAAAVRLDSQAAAPPSPGTSGAGLRPATAGLPLDKFAVGGFVAAYLIVVLRMFDSLKGEEEPKSAGKDGEDRPEMRSWKAGIVDWLCIGWATPWVRRWGNAAGSSTTKIDVADLGRPGDPKDESYYGSKRFEELWTADLAAHGNDGKNIYRVVLRLGTHSRFIRIALLTLVYMALLFVVPVYAIQCTLESLASLHTQQALHPASVGTADLWWPSLRTILCFLLSPVAMVVTETVGSLMILRLMVRISGSLSAAAYQKAQRLPPGGCEFKVANNEGEETPYSFVQLVNVDLGNSLRDMIVAAFQVMATLPIFLILVCQLLVTLRRAALGCFSLTIGMLFVMTLLIRAQVGSYVDTLNAAGERVALSQEVIHGIRVIKAYGWEEAVEKRLRFVRRKEVAHLRVWYTWLGSVVFLSVTLPRIIALGSLAAYVSCYGSIPATSIFMIVQLLGSFNGAMRSIMTNLPKVLAAVPSFVRLQRFFSLEEMTPKHETGADGAVRVCGSFRWPGADEPALHDLSLEVPAGSLVAVVGEVGAGKTALISALLGEMEPVDAADVRKPASLAYHPQVPYICEGTLRQNVLFCRALQEERYQQALEAACLRRDLEILPGGDKVPIGARGVALSGGQRVRVSLARAAYTEDASLVLLDDPFGAVDAPTAEQLFEKLLMGPLMHGRTRIVVCQPHVDRLRLFDQVVVISEGRIVAQGLPAEVLQLPELRALLRMDDSAMAELKGQVSTQVATLQSSKEEDSQVAMQALREEEHEGRIGMTTISWYQNLGSWTVFLLNILAYCAFVVLSLVSDIVLASWSDAELEAETRGEHSTNGYLLRASYAFLASMVLYALAWRLGTRWTLNISAVVHDIIIRRLLQASVDRFYDKTPVGRILNRLSTDLSSIDTTMYMRVSASIATMNYNIVPLVYIHLVTPLWFTLAAAPVYYLFCVMIARFWNVVVPMRYCTSVSRSSLNELVSEVQQGAASVRAYRVSDALATEEATAVDRCLTAELAAGAVRRWIVNRVMIILSFFITAIALMAFWCPDALDVGTVGLCLTNLMLIITNVTMMVDMLTAAQLEFVALNRLHEYMYTPQERPNVLTSDRPYQSITAWVQRSELGAVRSVRREDRALVVRRAADGWEEVVLEAFAGGLRPPRNRTFSDLLPHREELKELSTWHTLTAANGRTGPDNIAEELCAHNGPDVRLRLQSGWLLGGAKVVVKDLVAGYADMPVDVLKGISFVVEARDKAAIVGTTGCGKSTLLLCILRILEPRCGRIEINGVSNQDLGLQTLRRSLGLVPQDPVLFSGTVRDNLDPFDEFTDKELWRALRAMQLEKPMRKKATPRNTPRSDTSTPATPRSDSPESEGTADEQPELPGGLDYQVGSAGENLSFGQRQLLCIARMIMRQPALLLLDECTSAVDPRTQELVQAAIDTEFPNSTMIVIAHRLETVINFDVAVVLERGKVVEQGPLKKLVGLEGGHFARLLAAARH